MDPIIGAAILSGISNIWTSNKNSENQSRQNAFDLKNAKEMYALQRADNLADRDFNNKYNSPDQQMERLRQAGLNPNLVYGSGANNAASVVRSSDYKVESQIAPKIDSNIISNSLAQYSQMKAQQAQTDNIKQLTIVAEKDALLKDATIAGQIQSTASNKFQLEQSQKLQDATIMKANLDNQEKNLGLQLQKQSLQLGLEKNEREKIAQSSNLAKTMQDIIASKADTKNKNLEAAQKRELMELDLQLKRKGLQPSDPIYIRAVANWYDQFKKSFNTQGKDPWPQIKW